tara:strand:+ start:4874 stop:5383 length:510 start_codon:yes stop_codon:yes gene_type:complete
MPNPTPVIDIMSYEPWYQAQSPSKADVINSVNKSEFISNLNKEENTEYENIKLNQYATDLMQTLDRPIINITYDNIRSIWKWSELRDEIINDEITKEEKKGFGSYRGYYTFVHTPLCNSIRVRMIHEYAIREHLKEKIKILIPKWIEKRYAPGGNGYIEAREHFNLISS